MVNIDDTTGDDICVWLVEDEASYRDTFAFLINRVSDMSCPGVFPDAESLLSALESAPASDRPEVILMDINLPGMSGIDCTTQVLTSAPNTRIVMLTIYDDEERIAGALRNGACGYVLKNASLDKLIAAIREAWQGGMLMEKAVADKVLSFFAQPGNGADYGLTPRETEVLARMVEGLSQKQIADALFISTSTVNGHIQHIYEKLHVHTGSAAVAKAVRERLV